MAYKVIEEDFNNVVDYFNKNHNNIDSAIAKKLNLKEGYVSYLLDVYLSKKRNYMGAIPIIVTGMHRGRKKVIVYDSKGDILDVYDSVTECSIILKISKATVSKHLNNPNIKNHKGYTFKYYNVNK